MANTDLLRPEAVQSLLKSNRDFYEKGVEGFGTIYESKEHDALLKSKFKEAVALIDEINEEYSRLYHSLDTTRSVKINPKYVDVNFARLIGRYFDIEVPESGKYGVLDLNKVGYKFLAIYTREKGLKNKQFFTLDEELRALVESPSLEDPSKTYLQLTQERVDEKAAGKEKITASCSNILHHNGQISMNISASKILIPKFGLDYSPADAEKYVPQIKEIIDLLTERYDALVEEEKKPKEKESKDE